VPHFEGTPTRRNFETNLPTHLLHPRAHHTPSFFDFITLINAINALSSLTLIPTHDAHHLGSLPTLRPTTDETLGR
jgi:hypothetical protein